MSGAIGHGQGPRTAKPPAGPAAMSTECSVFETEGGRCPRGPGRSTRRRPRQTARASMGWGGMPGSRRACRARPILNRDDPPGVPKSSARTPSEPRFAGRFARGSSCSAKSLSLHGMRWSPNALQGMSRGSHKPNVFLRADNVLAPRPSLPSRERGSKHLRLGRDPDLFGSLLRGSVDRNISAALALRAALGRSLAGRGSKQPSLGRARPPRRSFLPGGAGSKYCRPLDISME